jgi:hypothetical protein
MGLGLNADARMEYQQKSARTCVRGAPTCQATPLGYVSASEPRPDDMALVDAFRRRLGSGLFPYAAVGPKYVS